MAPSTQFVSSRTEDPTAEYHLGPRLLKDNRLILRHKGWTARIETLLEYYHLQYTAVYVHLNDSTALLANSPSGLVPVLTSKTLGPAIRINDSFAVSEFLAVAHPNAPLYPADAQLRALARCAVGEIHSGFHEVRNTYHSNVLARYTGPVPVSEKGRREIERILAVWGNAREVTVRRLAELGKEHEDDGFLFGRFGIVDSFYWPVLWRFRTYNLPLTTATPETLKWMKKMWDDPTLKGLVKDYFQQAERPETFHEKYENVFKDIPDVMFGRFDEDWEFSLP